MRAVAIFLLGLMTVAGCAKAQDPPVVTELTPLSEGTVELAITNNTLQPITAYIIVADQYPPAGHREKGTSIRYSDSVALHFSDRPIEHRDTQRFTYTAPRAGSTFGKVEVHLKAAVFIDGSVFGDPDWIERIVQSRRFFCEDLGIAVEKLQTALQANTPLDQVLEEFEKLESSNRDRNRSLEEKRASGTVFGTVCSNLKASAKSEGNGPSANEVLSQVFSMVFGWRQWILTSKPSVCGPAVESPRDHPGEH